MIPGDASEAEFRRWLRDMGALLALPALWVDHEPGEIATGLLSVLFGVLQLGGAYARFDDPWGGEPLESWRPSGPSVPAELLPELQWDDSGRSGIMTKDAQGRGHAALRVAAVPIVLPWETGLVLVSAARADFPTAIETHLLRVAVSQAAIAIHTARRLRRETRARSEAEEALRQRNELLRSLVDDLEPSLVSLSNRVHRASRLTGEPAASPPEPAAPRAHLGPAPGAGGSRSDVSPLFPLTHRELDVLGLLAQGLSNKEIAGVLWLSDRTVERHITSLYRKIGVARRSEATAFALRSGLV